MLNNLLFYRLLILNLIGAAGVGWGLFMGYIQVLFESETTGIGYLMVALFAVGLYGIFSRAHKVSKSLNYLKARSAMAMDGVEKYNTKNAYIGDISIWLVTLGLIGNIMGFYIAVDGLDLSGGPEAAIAGIDHMIEGMKVAFGTTLIGTVLGLWLHVNFRVLTTATDLLVKDTIG